MTARVSRRDFLRSSAAATAGLTIAVSFGACGGDPALPVPPHPFAPDAWIRVGTDGLVTVMVDRAEMGQGISTGLPMLVAEELDAAWAQVRFERAPAHPAYANPLQQGMQVTGGSTSIRAAWGPLREAAAKARAMLVQAAAEQWGVEPSSCRTEDGRVHHEPSGRSLGYGELATAAAAQPVPREARVKDPSQFRLIGRALPRLDSPEVVRGAPIYAGDVRVPGMLTAVVARCPAWGGRVVSFDAAAALAVPGVRQVLPVRSGIAVVADGFWAAEQGRRALVVQWDAGAQAALDDAAIDAELQRALDAPHQPIVHREGLVGPALQGAARRLEAQYALPYLAHATMEPMVCAAEVRDGACTVWAPTQMPWAPSLYGGGTAGVAAKAAGVPIERVTVHSTQLGGGFGRRAEMDFVEEAVEVAAAIQGAVRLQWTREDDMQHDWYRPAVRHALSGGLDDAGRPVAWAHRVAGPSILSRYLPSFVPDWVANRMGVLKEGADPSTFEGAAEVPYALGAVEVMCCEADLPVPIGFWRAVGHSHTAFAVESFIDELAHLAGADPFTFRRDLLGDAPRHRAVLELAAARAGWGTPLPEGRARGIAVHESFGSWVAQVAEVSRDDDGRPRVHRVTCAIDCGIAVHPDQIAAQMESSIVYGLSAALYGGVRIAQGRAQASNFHDQPVLRIDRMPVVETHIVPSAEPPGGVGEPGLPPIAPAVANAWFALTGERVRRLPFVGVAS
jgi:isoquinoline 1-oxidoreductase subunit beta